MEVVRHPLPSTLEDTIGPYFPPGFLTRSGNDLLDCEGLVFRPHGTPIRLEGVIRDAQSAPVAPALVEFWQADAEGRFAEPGAVGDRARDPWFGGTARHYAHDGRYRLTTVKPGASPGRAPHITITIFCDGISKVATQIFLEDEIAANAADPLLLSLPEPLRDRLVAKQVGKRDGLRLYECDIVLRGDGETPFFDDVES